VHECLYAVDEAIARIQWYAESPRVSTLLNLSLFIPRLSLTLYPLLTTYLWFTLLGLNGIKISVDEDEAIENVIKKFKRSVNQSGHLMELRFREQWETVAEKKKRKMQRNRQLNRIERTNDRYERLAEGQSEYNS
jgi:small subunit ribosomal protein S21